MLFPSFESLNSACNLFSGSFSSELFLIALLNACFSSSISTSCDLLVSKSLMLKLLDLIPKMLEISSSSSKNFIVSNSFDRLIQPSNEGSNVFNILKLL